MTALPRTLLIASVLSAPALAAPPAPGSDDALAMAGHEAWIKGQNAPGGQYCCDLSDGRPAEVRRTGDHYEVFYSREHWEDGTDQWIAVPPSAVLPQASPLFVPVAWILRGRVYCLALANGS